MMYEPKAKNSGRFTVNIQFERAVPGDADLLISVQNQSFYSDYIKYGFCPGYNRSRDSMVESILNRIVYKILCDGTVVGDIIIRDNSNGDYYLGCICVIPDYENKGIGQTAMNFIDTCFPDAIHWSLATPSDKLKNHYFYQKYGFKITKEYNVDGVLMFSFEKSKIS
jgi:ribosomal protein S18 acetylase RimI-like enzyme